MRTSTICMGCQSDSEWQVHDIVYTKNDILFDRLVSTFLSFFYFNNSVKCPCNVIHDSVTLIFTFLIIIIIIIIIAPSYSIQMSMVTSACMRVVFQ